MAVRGLRNIEVPGAHIFPRQISFARCGCGEFTPSLQALIIGCG
jgi:hypothetical protein